MPQSKMGADVLKTLPAGIRSDSSFSSESICGCCRTRHHALARGHTSDSSACMLRSWERYCRDISFDCNDQVSDAQKPQRPISEPVPKAAGQATGFVVTGAYSPLWRVCFSWSPCSGRHGSSEMMKMQADTGTTSGQPANGACAA